MAARDVEQDAMEAIRLGAKGYFPKDAAPDQLIEAVRAVYGDYVFVLAHTGPAPREMPKQLGVGGREPPTRRELEVLRLVALGYHNQQIAAELSIVEHTVEYHVSNLLGKFRAASRTELIYKARQSGFLN